MNSRVKNEYTWETKVASYDVGPDLRLRPSSLLKLQQEVGELHLSDAGLSYTELYEKGIVFVLVRLSSVVYRAPAFGERIYLTTWHRDNKGPRFFRCYRVTDEEGGLLADGVSAFAVVDPIGHKPLRPLVFEKVAGITAQPERFNSCPDPERWLLPDDMAAVGTRIVRWSDLDCNDHLGNTSYPDIALDALADRINWRDNAIVGFSLAFQNEAREGERLALAAAAYPDKGEAWVAARLEDGRPCFEMRVQYREEGGRE